MNICSVYVRTQERRGGFWKWLERCTFILLKNHVKLLQKQNNKRNVFVKKSWMEHLLDSECRNGAFKVFKAATYIQTMGCFIYILDSSNSISFTFWSSQFASSSRSNWSGIWNGDSNSSWMDKHSYHFSNPKEISVKATFFFM
jgi:hypothetical protein